MQANQLGGMAKINFPCEYLTNSSCSEIVSYLIRGSALTHRVKASMDFFLLHSAWFRYAILKF